ncbi:hypothetical protein GZH46_02244, partial [Fragariocoptes setiger]
MPNSITDLLLRGFLIVACIVYLRITIIAIIKFRAAIPSAAIELVKQSWIDLKFILWNDWTNQFIFTLTQFNR